MKWFKHFSKAHEDRAVETIINEFGASGYGLYFYCIELIVGSIDADQVTFELEPDAPILAKRLNLDTVLVEKIMHRCIDLGLFEISDSGRLTCLKIGKYLEKSITSNPFMRNIIAQSKAITTSNPDKSGVLPGVPDQNRIDKNRIDTDTHTEAPEVRAGVLESIKHPSNLPRLIYDKWQAIPGVTKDCDYMYWIQREWREIARAIEGFHSDIVLASLDNYKKERDNPNTWMTAKVSSRQFFTGGLFETCRGATDAKKHVPRCKACTCQLLPAGVPNAGTCQNDECDMYHRRQE